MEFLQLGHGMVMLPFNVLRRSSGMMYSFEHFGHRIFI